MENITDAIYGSRKTICVISRHYLQSEWCSREIQMARWGRHLSICTLQALISLVPKLVPANFLCVVSAATVCLMSRRTC